MAYLRELGQDERIMNDPVLTPELERTIAEAMKQRKPYLIGLEEEVQKVQHGSITLKVYVRNGSVDKMEFESVSTWIREKSIDTK